MKKTDSSLVHDITELLKKKSQENKWAKPEAIRDKCWHYGEKPLEDHFVN